MDHISINYKPFTPYLTWDGEVQDEEDLVFAALLGIDCSEAHRPAALLPSLRLARLPRSVGVRHRVRLVFVGAVVDGAVMAVNEGGDVAEKEGSKPWEIKTQRVNEWTKRSTRRISEWL